MGWNIKVLCIKSLKIKILCKSKICTRMCPGAFFKKYQLVKIRKF